MPDTDRTYPPLPQTLGLSLEAIRQQMDFDPGFLVDAKCPYPEQLKVFLRRLVTPSRTGQLDTADAVFLPGQSDDDEADSLIEEVQNAINSMKRLQRDLDASNDMGEKLTFLKNYSSLIDRFLALKEKAQGLKQMYEFQRVVVDTMEQVLSKDQRLDFKERLKKIHVNSA